MKEPHIVKSKVHRQSGPSGHGAWKSVPEYCFNTGFQMIESNCYISGRDRYNDFSERFSNDNGLTWGNDLMRFPTVHNNQDVTRACEMFLGLDENSNTLFRGYIYGTYMNDDNDEYGAASFARNAKTIIEISKDGGQTFQQILDVEELLNEKQISLQCNKKIKPMFSCSHIEVLKNGTLLFPLILRTVDIEHTYEVIYYACVLIGRWSNNGKDIVWDIGNVVPMDLTLSPSGVSESSVIELPNQKIVSICRGGNQGNASIPSHKWLSVSSDEGVNWTQARPLTFTNNEPIYSPSSQPRLFMHSSGRLYLITNLFPEKYPKGCSRNALHMVEIDQDSLEAIKDTVTVIDERKEGESPHTSFSNFHVYEDRKTKDVCVLCPKIFANQYGKNYKYLDYGDSICMFYRINIPATTD